MILIGGFVSDQLNKYSSLQQRTIARAHKLKSNVHFSICLTSNSGTYLNKTWLIVVASSFIHLAGKILHFFRIKRKTLFSKPWDKIISIKILSWLICNQLKNSLNACKRLKITFKNCPIKKHQPSYLVFMWLV